MNYTLEWIVSAVSDPNQQPLINDRRQIKITIEINVEYGVNIPKKAEEIQTAVVEELTKMTGLRVSEIHVVFKGLKREELLPSEQLSQKIPDEGATSFHEELQSEF